MQPSLTVMPRAASIALGLFESVAKTSRALSKLTLEQLLEDPDMGGLPLSDAQRALCRAAEGETIVHLDREQIHKHFGVIVSLDEPPTLEFSERPRTVLVRSGVRSGKSLIGAFGALLRSVLTCVFRRPPIENERPGKDGLVGVRPGELVRALVVAPLLKASRQPFHHLVGSLLASQELKATIVGTPGAESVKIRREDGNVVQVELVAASAGGLNLRSTWLAGILFDEADFHDGDDGAVNLRENHRAIVPRMLANGQIWIVSSPWSDSGHYHEMFTEAFGKPGRTLAFHSPSLDMNPTLDRVDIETERKRDPENAAREFDAVPLASSSLQFFPESAITACCVLDENNATPDGSVHFGGCDWGFRKNSSAVAFAKPNPAEQCVDLSYMEELVPSRGSTLKPSEVVSSFAESSLRYNSFLLKGDAFSLDTVLEGLPKVRNKNGACVEYEVFHPSSEKQTEVATEFRRRMLEGKVRLPKNPRLIQQLKDVRVRKSDTGVKVTMPKRGASHGDVLMAVMLACVQVPAELYEEQEPVALTTNLFPISRTISSIGGRSGSRRI